MLSERDRRSIAEGFTEVLGEERAELVMSVLPWSRPATADDLNALATSLRGEMAELRGELKAEMGELRGELKGEMGGLEGQMGGLKAEMGGLKGEMAELSSKISSRLVIAQTIGSAATVGVLLTAGAMF